MTNNPANKLKNALVIDYTGTVSAAKQMDRFNKDFVKLIRADAKQGRVVLVIDRAIASRQQQALMVRDHINLSGDNPLLGPNDPCGQRFPIVQGIYLSEGIKGLSSGVVAGIKEGTKPDEEEQHILKTLGVEACSYNMVPSMLVAAHAGWQVLGIVLPENAKLSDEQIQEVNQIAEGK